MEPRIQYAKTSDGVNIAYYTIGEGEPPLVEIPILLDSHLQLGWQAPEGRSYIEALSENRMVVQYDSRGTGLSDRKATEYSLEALLLDLEAVVDRLNLGRFALWGPGITGPVAITYAAANPDRVSHLILWHTWARTRDTASAQARGLARLLDADWELYTETVARWSTGWAEGEIIRRLAARYRESITQEALQAFFRAMNQVDVTDLLGQVQSPTLVLHRRQAPVGSVDIAKGLASRIPGGRLVLLEGTTSAPFVDPAPLIQAINEFLAEGPAAGVPDLPSGTAIILFADIVDSTGLTERMGDAAFRERARELDGALRSAIRDAGGTAVEGKLVGDGLMAVFTSARQAIESALRCGRAGDEGGLPLHLGVHAGDVIREENNVYGGAVNIASRISGLSAPGEVLVSDTVRGLARTSAGVSFEDRGGQSLKGVGEPVRIWAVRSSTEGQAST